MGKYGLCLTTSEHIQKLMIKMIVAVFLFWSWLTDWPDKYLGFIYFLLEKDGVYGLGNRTISVKFKVNT